MIRVRWWMWPIALVLLLVAAVLTIRAQGWSRYQAVQADLRSRGFPTTPVEWVATAPPVDPGRQARLRNLLNASGLWRDWGCGMPTTLWEGEWKPPKGRPSLEQTLADGEATACEVGEIMDEGPVLVSWFGWADRDPKVLAHLSPEAALAGIPTLMGCRALTNWWAASAVTSPDPAPHLHRLDQFLAGCDHCSCLIDAMVAIAMARIRDDTYLYLATRGRLADPYLQRWIREPSPYRRWAADGYAGERCLGLEPLSRMPSLAVTYTPPGLSSFAETRSKVEHWLMFYHELAAGAANDTRIEARMRGSSLRAAVRPATGPVPGFLSTDESSAILACGSSFHHRLARVAGLLAARFRAGSALPGDATSLAASLPTGVLDPTPDEPGVLYERLGPARFRIGCDPSTPPPIPPISWMGGVVMGNIDSEIGKPASRDPVNMKTWSIELDLNGLLVPRTSKKPKP